jgi:hypothetical protein
MIGDVFLLLLVFTLGVLVGLNIKHDLENKKFNKNFNNIDEEIRNRLAIAENLNQSLKQDKEFLKEKIWKLEQDNGKK